MIHRVPLWTKFASVLTSFTGVLFHFSATEKMRLFKGYISDWRGCGGKT
jgi:hypothetical protein